MRTEQSQPVIAIIGAGSGMGLAIAKTFGAHGFKVALLSRSPEKLEPIVADLASTASKPPPFAPTCSIAQRSGTVLKR